jgi:hypothetical protein
MSTSSVSQWSPPPRPSTSTLRISRTGAFCSSGMSFTGMMNLAPFVSSTCRAWSRPRYAALAARGAAFAAWRPAREALAKFARSSFLIHSGVAINLLYGRLPMARSSRCDWRQMRLQIYIRPVLQAVGCRPRWIPLTLASFLRRARSSEIYSGFAGHGLTCFPSHVVVLGQPFGVPSFVVVDRLCVRPYSGRLTYPD